ncbi:MAG: hypothetical protein ABI835_16870, partial [Chloroflexota bacterium]
MLRRSWLLVGLLVLLSVPFASLAAQEQPTISIAVSSFLKNNFDESIFDDFEAEHGVQVYVNYVDANVGGGDINEILDALAEYAAAADVLTVTQQELLLFATRAGYFLDLSPLTSADPDLNPDDFFPAAWDSVQWDNGVWALPTSVDATMLIYDQAPFDDAGLTYPNDGWNIDDLLNAARALTQYDSNGDIALSGLTSFGSAASLLRAFYGQDFADESGNPRFAAAALEDILTKWQEYQTETQSDSGVVFGTQQPPMRIMGSFGLSFGTDPNQPAPQAVPLPGGNVAITLNALAVSSGTQQPELAYELAKYLSSSPEFANSPFNGLSARQSLASSQASAQPGGDGGEVNVQVGRGSGAIFFAGGSSPEAKAALIGLMGSALSLVDQGYGSYIDSALQAMAQDETDAHTALLDAEAQAEADLQAAEDRRDSVAVIVATPPPAIVLQPGEVELKFGIQSFVQPIPNLDQWQRLANDFAAADPDVGAVTLDADFGDVATFAERDDCFYLSSNAVPSLDGSSVINLDPYLDADANFDPNDVVGGLMAQLQKDSRTWAYPLTIQPQALNINTDLFAQAGVPVPENSWTIEQFVDALQVLTDYTGKAAFVPRDFNGESLMMLIAAFGGLPIDYRTTPATLKFSDPAAVDAIRQVLDLAKDGTIDYQELAGGGGFRVVSFSSTDEPDAITSDSLGGFRRIRGGPAANDDPTRLTIYPSGTYSGASYQIGTGYISVNAENPDACYRWLSYVAQNIDVFSAIPARLSQINDPNLQASAGENASFYSAYADVLASPNTLVFPSAGGGANSIGDFITQFWLNRTFDNYVLRDGDLEADLADAQTYATAFQQCIAQLPP